MLIRKLIIIPGCYMSEIIWIGIWERNMKYLFCLLIPAGLFLLIISIKYVIRFAKAEMIYEMPYSRGTGTFTLAARGKYGLWISGKSLKKRRSENLDWPLSTGIRDNPFPCVLLFAYCCDRAQQVQAEIVFLSGGSRHIYGFLEWWSAYQRQSMRVSCECRN